MLSVIKIGSHIIDHPERLSQVLDDFATTSGKKILVHGGGALATEMLGKLNIPTKMHQGRRITDPESLKIVSMVYAGWVNKHIVAELQKRGCNALGLSGADANAIPAHKRPVGEIDFGEVGDIIPSEINEGLISMLLVKDIVPVFCSITHDGQGHLLNTNADTLASSVAMALAPRYPTHLVYHFEEKGVLSDTKDPNSLIPLITAQSYRKLLDEGIVSGGMIPKLDTAFLAIAKGVNEVRISQTVIK